MHFSNKHQIRHRRWYFHGGIKLPGHKSLSNRSDIQIASIPKLLIIPLQQHIGDPAIPLVDVGDKVLAGELIARAPSYISAPVHASSSGTVLDIGDYPVAHPSGLSAPCIVIETDGQDRWIDPPHDDILSDMTAEEIREKIRQSGITGLGGASFPSSVKLNPGPDHPIETPAQRFLPRLLTG